MAAKSNSPISSALFIKIGRKSYPVASLKEASEMFCAARDKSGLGASRVPDAFVINGAGDHVAHISYNGRVWEPREWQVGDEPLYDNQISAVERVA
jgi:hypothetical protein